VAGAFAVFPHHSFRTLVSNDRWKQKRKNIRVSPSLEDLPHEPHLFYYVTFFHLDRFYARKIAVSRDKILLTSANISKNRQDSVIHQMLESSLTPKPLCKQSYAELGNLWLKAGILVPPVLKDENMLTCAAPVHRYSQAVPS
jgi:hypothetical protein